MSRDRKPVHEVITILGEYPVDASPSQIEEGKKRIKEASQTGGMGCVESFLILVFVSVIIAVGISLIGQKNPEQPISSSGNHQQQTQQTITISNRLLRPVQIYIGNRYRGDIQSQERVSFNVQSTEQTVNFHVIPILDYGDDMSGVFWSVSPGTSLVINNVIGDKWYFFPEMTNQTSYDCDISINYGYVSERSSGILRAHTARVVAGYFRLYNNGNVTLLCRNGMTYYWGTHPGHPVTPIDFVQAETGLLTLTLAP